MTDRNHSRVTALVRLLLSAWLMVSSLLTFADPFGPLTASAAPLSTRLPLAGLSFALGVFLVTGFMSRIVGALLAGMGAWQMLSFGFAFSSAALAMVGVYLIARGGGAWAMDIYVQRMQDRARRRALRSPERL